MVKVTDSQIIVLTKGDSASLTVKIFDGEQEYDYSNDTVKLGVKRQLSDSECIIEKTVEDGKVTFEPEDTKDLKVGSYFYDLKIVCADGSVCTVIASAQFILGNSVLTNFTAEEQDGE